LGIAGATTLGAAAVDNDKQSQTTVPPPSSRGFFRDLISDQDGIAVTRLQFVVWTAVLICVFVATVFRTFAMPSFDTTMLTLMGISSGTYVGLKLPS
jgi:hypothetical protein